MSIPLTYPALDSAARPVLLGCPDCGRPELLLRVGTPIRVTVTQTTANPFDPHGYTISRVDHSPTAVVEPRPIGVQCTGCGWTTLAPNWTDHLTPVGV